MEVHAAGGGIHFTVDKTRDASEEELFLLLSERLRKMMRNGTLNSFKKWTKEKIFLGNNKIYGPLNNLKEIKKLVELFQKKPTEKRNI